MRRITLGPSVTRADLQQLALSCGWSLDGVVERDGVRPYEEIWSVTGGASAVHYIEDELIAVRYVLAMGEDEAGIAARIADGIETVDPIQAATQARSAHGKEERMRGIAYLASAAPPAADPRIVAAFGELLADPDPDIRQGALFAAAYPAWRELDPLLERTVEQDPEPRLRDAAAKALAAIRRHRDDSGERPH